MSNPGFGSSERFFLSGFGGDGGHVDKAILNAQGKGRSQRRNDAKLFRPDYRYSDDISEHRTCIWSDNEYRWDAKSSGIAWVGVCGKKTMCVVTMTRDVDLARACSNLKYCTKDTLLRMFRKIFISEMEDLESTTGKSIKMPFGVVCVTDNLHHTSRTDVADKGSGLEGSRYYFEQKQKAWDLFLDEFKKTKHPDEFDKKDEEQYEKTKDRIVSTLKKTIMARSVFAECDEEKAIEFLKEKMKTESYEDFTVEKTIETAISAFQHLFKREFKANEIEVSYIDPDFKLWGPGILRTSNINFKELNFGRIEDYLAIINSNGGRKKKSLEKEDPVEPGLGKQNG